MSAAHQSPEVRSAQGIGAWSRGAEHPAIIINPAASKADLMHWVMAELESLHQWLEVMEGATSGIELPQSQVASLVTERLAPVLRVFNAAFEADKAPPQPGTA